MGDLVRHISAESAIGYGVNVWDQDPVTPVRGDSSNVIGVVMAMPWGPVDEAVTVTTQAELFATFYPSVFGAPDPDAYPAVLAVINKPIFTRGGLRVVRPGLTGQEQASGTDADATDGDSVVITARYPGTAGNQIQRAWTANADDPTARDLTVTIGSAYSVTYPAVAIVVGGALVVTDPGDPYVTVAKAPGGTAVPAAMAATPLEGGSDGAAVAADFTGSELSAKGIRCLYGSSAPDVLFVAECPTGLIDAVNAALKAWAEDNPGGVAPLCTVPGQSKADARTYAPTYRTGTQGRTSYHWPRVKTTNAFDPARGQITVDGNAFAAACIANVDPWTSPGGPARAALLAGITGLEDESASMADLDLLNAAGVAPFFMVRGRAIIRKAVTTSTTGRTKIVSRRMTDYITSSIAQFLEQFAEETLDIDLANRELGENTGTAYDNIVDFLEALKGAGRIRDYLVDPYAANTQADIDADRWTVIIVVKLMSTMDEIVLQANIGETVEVAEAA